MAPDREVELDRALAGDRSIDDEELSGLVDAAARVSRALDAEPRGAARERALFISGVAARRQRFPVARFAVPALALVGSLVLLGALGRVAQPGETFYPVRKVLAPIAPRGVVESPLEEADKLIASADRKIERAEDLENDSPARAAEIAGSALADLDEARPLAQDAGASERLDEINDLRDDANDVIADTVRSSRSGSSGRDDSGGGGDDDSSGPGGGGDSGGDDNSGPG